MAWRRHFRYLLCRNRRKCQLSTSKGTQMLSKDKMFVWMIRCLWVTKVRTLNHFWFNISSITFTLTLYTPGSPEYKDRLCRYRDCQCKDDTVVGILIAVKRHFYIKTFPWVFFQEIYFFHHELLIVTIIRILWPVLSCWTTRLGFLKLSDPGSTKAHLPGCFRPWTFSLNIWLNMLPSDCFMSCLHVCYRVVPGFATDCSCGVWCRGLATCLLYIGPLFWKCSLKG